MYFETSKSPLFFWCFFLAVFVPFFHMNVIINLSYFMKNINVIYFGVLHLIYRLVGGDLAINL